MNKSIFSKALALMLALMMAFSALCVIGAFADEEGETPAAEVTTESINVKDFCKIYVSHVQVGKIGSWNIGENKLPQEVEGIDDINVWEDITEEVYENGGNIDVKYKDVLKFVLSRDAAAEYIGESNVLGGFTALVSYDEEAVPCDINNVYAEDDDVVITTSEIAVGKDGINGNGGKSFSLSITLMFGKVDGEESKSYEGTVDFTVDVDNNLFYRLWTYFRDFALVIFNSLYSAKVSAGNAASKLFNDAFGSVYEKIVNWVLNLDFVQNIIAG